MRNIVLLLGIIFLAACSTDNIGIDPPNPVGNQIDGSAYTSGDLAYTVGGMCTLSPTADDFAWAKYNVPQGDVTVHIQATGEYWCAYHAKTIGKWFWYGPFTANTTITAPYDAVVCVLVDAGQPAATVEYLEVKKRDT